MIYQSTYIGIRVALACYDLRRAYIWLQTLALIETVTMGIAKELQRLQDLGMNRILVNNMHPLGCTPFRTRPNNYTHCDDVANAVAVTHNKLLAEKLGNYRGNVMLLDLNTAFSRVVQPNPSMSATSSDLSCFYLLV